MRLRILHFASGLGFQILRVFRAEAFEFLAFCGRVVGLRVMGFLLGFQRFREGVLHEFWDGTASSHKVLQGFYTTEHVSHELYAAVELELVQALLKSFQHSLGTLEGDP